MWGSVTNFILNHEAQLWSLATVVFGAIIARVLRLKPKIVYSIPHSSTLIVDQPLLDGNGKPISPRQLVRTASITVQNTGLRAARGVEVTFNWKPQILNVVPARAFDGVASALDRYSLRFDSLAPGEWVSIEIMSINSDLPWMTAVRSEECTAKIIQMEPQRVWPTWFLRLVAVILFLGSVTAIYLLAKIIQLIAS